MSANKEDARLLVQLAQWGAMIGLNDATAALFDDAFDPDTATSQDRNVRAVLTVGETIGTLVKNDLLDRELVLDWLWVSGLWQRVAPAVRRDRERYAEPRLGENFEALASG
jgi:hypothetical protein